MSGKKQNSTTQTVYSGLKSQSTITIILGGLEIVTFSIMSRLLSKEDFGYYAVITAVTVILQTITEAGMGSSVIQKKDASKEYISTAFTLSFAIGVSFSVFLFLAAPLFSEIMVKSDNLTLAFRIMAVPLLLSNVNSIARAMMMRQLDFFKYGIFTIIAYIVSSCVGIYLASIGRGFYSIIVTVITNQILSTILLYSFVHFKPSLKIDKREAKSIFVFGGWLTGSAVIRSITEQLDKFILSRWISVTALGAFNRPSGFISKMVNQINGIFDTVLYPIVSRMQNDKNKINTSYSTCVVLMALMSCFLMSSFFLGSKLIIWIFLGDKWMELSSIFQIISISIVAICYCRVADIFFRATGFVKLYFWNRVLTCFLTVTCLFVGCQFGIMGAAIALAFSKFMDLLVKICMFRNIITIKRIEIWKQIYHTCKWPILIFLICTPLLIFKYGSIIALFIYCCTMAIIGICFPLQLGDSYNSYIFPQVKPFINKYIRK